jgi:ketosteroid isomerase-like protein
VGTVQEIRLNLKFQIAELHLLSPDWAFLRSTSSGQMTILGNGAVVPSANQELFLLNKIRGQWKLARYSLSSTLPN